MSDQTVNELIRSVATLHEQNRAIISRLDAMNGAVARHEGDLVEMKLREALRSGGLQFGAKAWGVLIVVVQTAIMVLAIRWGN